MSTVMRHSQFGDLFFLVCQIFFSLNVDLKQTLKANFSCLAVTINTDIPICQAWLPTRTELALSQYDQKGVVSSSLNNWHSHHVLGADNFHKTSKAQEPEITSVSFSEKHIDLIIQLFQEIEATHSTLRQFEVAHFYFTWCPRGCLFLKGGRDIKIYFQDSFIKNYFK